MIRNYPMSYASRVKARREKFASTRKSLSETWDNQSFGDDEGQVGYPDLPSPTIGDKEMSPRLSLSEPSFSPILGRRSEERDILSYEASPRSSADPAVPYVLWKREVGIQCNFYTIPGHIFQISSQSECPPKKFSKSGVPLRRWKSFDWNHFPDKPWTPFFSFVPKDHIHTLRKRPTDLISRPKSHLYEPPPSKRGKDHLLEPQSRRNQDFDTTNTFIQLQTNSCEICGVEILPSDDEQQQQVPEKAIKVPTSLPIAPADQHTSSGGGSTHFKVHFLNPDEGSTSTSGPKESDDLNQPGTSASFKPSATVRPTIAFTLPIPETSQQQQQQPSCSTSSAQCASIPSTLSTGAPPIHIEGCGRRNKSSTLPILDSKHISAIRSAETEKRRGFFARKQTNSAPDSFDGSTLFNVSQGVISTTRRLCANCKAPVTNCLDVVLRATRRENKSSTESPTKSTTKTPTVEVWESEIRTACCGDVSVTHVSELDYPSADAPCHFCCEHASTAIHDESRLQIVSGGLVRSRDGSSRSGSAPYINLPSPNVQTENGRQLANFGSLQISPSMSQTLSPGSHLSISQSPPSHSLSINQSGTVSGQSSPGKGTNLKSEDDEVSVAPPASSLTRRPALVPPKIIPDDMEAERDKNGSPNEDSTSPRARRSSIVVIPPMQICPGDLLVYGKVLSQRKSLLGTHIEGSQSPVTSMFETAPEQPPIRKPKAAWSILKLFERGSRSKEATSRALEEIMSLIQPCDFSDPKLTRFKGMCWSDFVAHIATQKKKRLGTNLSIESGSSAELEGGTISKSDSKPELPHPAPIPSSKEKEKEKDKDKGNKKDKDKDKENSSIPKPLLRKRMGLMRTMSDRCLERRFTPALWKATGFLGEKLIEGKETEDKSDPKKSTPATAQQSSQNFKSNFKDSSKTAATDKTSSEEPNSTKISDTGSTEDPSTDPDMRQKTRQKEALWDLFQSECSFLYDHLMVLKNVFMEPMKRIQVEGFAMYAEPELLFGNLDELCVCTYGFCKEFIHLLLKGLTDENGQLSTTEVLGKLFEPSSKARSLSQAYHRYALNYINALNYLETLRRHAEFVEFEKLCMRDPRTKKLQLTDLLVSPVQHIMKIPLILKDIQSRTNAPPEKEIICQILEIQENSIRELDDKMRWLKNFERLLEIQRNIVWPSILETEPKTWVPDFLRGALSRQPCDSIVVSPRRQIIHEGLLQLWDSGKPSETYIILFDDMFLITRRKKPLSKKKSSLTENWASSGKSSSDPNSSSHRYIVYKQPISLDRFFIHDINEADPTSAKLEYAFVLVSLNRFQQIISVHTFQAPSDQVKYLAIKNEDNSGQMETYATEYGFQEF